MRSFSRISAMSRLSIVNWSIRSRGEKVDGTFSSKRAARAYVPANSAVQGSSSSWSRVLHAGHNRIPLKRMESPTLCFGGHYVLRRNQPRWWVATADTQIIAESSLPSIGCGHHLAGAVALDFPC